MSAHRRVYRVSAPIILSLLMLSFLAPIASALSIGGTLVASDYHVATVANVPVTVNVLADDSCVMNGIPCVDGMVVTSVSRPSHGSAVINPGYTVTYTPTPGFVGSDSFTYTATDSTGVLSGTGTVYVTVNQRTTTTSVGPPSASGVAGGTLTFTATVTDSDQGTPSLPSGGVSWNDSGAGGSFGQNTCNLSPTSSSQSLCSTTYTAPATAGTATIAASYAGDSAHVASSGKSSLTIQPPPVSPTTTTVSPNPASMIAGNKITVAASVTDTSASPSSPTGAVSWSDGGAGGSFSSGTCSLSSTGSSASSCQAAYTAPSVAGAVTVTGSYSGDSTHGASSGTSSLTVTSAQTLSIVKQTSGLVAFDSLNNVTMTQQQLQSQSRYWRYGGSAQGQSAPYQFNEDPQGFHLGVQAAAAGNYAGVYGVTRPANAQVYHAVITEPVQTVPQNVFNAGLYVQTGNGSIDFVSCGAQTTSFGTIWGVWDATGNSTMSKTFTQLWIDTSPNQPLTRSCTIVTNGVNYLTVYLDNSQVYQNSALKLSMPSPFIAFLEVQSSYSGQLLSATFTDFYASTTASLTVTNLPSSASSVQLVDSFGNLLMSSPVSNGVAVLDIGGHTFPLAAGVVVKDSGGSTIVASDILSLVGGDIYGVQAN